MSTLALWDQATAEHGSDWHEIAFSRPWYYCREDEDECWDGLDLEQGSYPAFDAMFTKAVREQNYLQWWPVQTLLTPAVQLLVQALLRTLQDVIPLQFTSDFKKSQNTPLEFISIKISKAPRGHWSRVVLRFVRPAQCPVDIDSWGYLFVLAAQEGDEAGLRNLFQQLLQYVEAVCDDSLFYVESYFPVDLDLFFSLWSLNALAMELPNAS